MLKTTLLALAIGFVAPAGVDTPTASAFPQPTLIVTVYYKDANRTQVIGEAWRGCGTPSGHWGGTSNWFTFRFPPCTPP